MTKDTFMTGRVFPLAQPPTPEALAAAVDAFFQDALSGFGPFEAAFSTLHVDSTPSAPDDFDVICDDVHDAAYDPEIASLVSRAAETLRPLVQVVIARTVRDLSYVVSADEHLSDDDLRAHVACVRRPSGVHLEIDAYRRITWHLFACAECRDRYNALEVQA